jgi:hypothetical protein
MAALVLSAFKKVAGLSRGLETSASGWGQVSQGTHYAALQKALFAPFSKNGYVISASYILGVVTAFSNWREI